jgi:hypothetical protein
MCLQTLTQVLYYCTYGKLGQMMKRPAERMKKGLEIVALEGGQREGNEYLTEGNPPSC